jgi:hypothetical protein
MPATLTIKPWPDPLLDTLGHDPRSLYVETFWLPTLGPTAVLLMRHLATKFDESPAGLDLPVADTSQALGLGQRDGNSSPIVRTLSRLAQFDLACDDGQGTVAVRRNLPPINRRHVRRLPVHLQTAHAEWAEAKLAEAPLATARRRARQVAFTLLEQGDDPDHVERVLYATGFHPSVCHDAARWAYQRHRDAMEAAVRATPEPAA